MRNPPWELTMPRAVLHRDSFRRLGGVVRGARVSSPSPDARLGDLPKIVEKMTAAEVDSVLRLIAQQARVVTGATGAAIALGAADEFFCRATAGETAPPLRARIRSDSGLTGECVRRRVTLRCDDSERDDRVDADACRALQVRSLAVVPVRSGSELAGVIEVFSNRVSAFSDSHLAILERMAELIATACRRAATLIMAAASEPAPPERAAGTTAVYGAGSSSATNLASSRLRGKELAEVASERMLAVLRACRTQVAANPRVVAAAALLVVLVSIAFLVSRGHAPRSTTEVVAASEAQVSAPPEKPAVVSAAAVPETTSATTSKPAAGRFAAARPAREPEPQEVTVLNVVPGDRRPAAAARVSDGDAAPVPEFGNISMVASAPTAVLGAPVGSPKLAPPPPPRPVSKGVEPGRLLRKVNPSYPIQAREARIAGEVVLDITIQKNGKVGKVSVVSGHPLLAQAAARAVKDWLYQPFRLNGQPIDAQTQVVVKFNR